MDGQNIIRKKNREKEFKRIGELKSYFIKELKKIYPKIEINGNKMEIQLKHNRNKVAKNLPNIINVYFPKQNSEELLIKLDLNGVAVSSGSACASFSAKKSHVLEAMGFSEERIKSSLRFSFGKFTTKEEIQRSLKAIKQSLQQ